MVNLPLFHYSIFCLKEWLKNIKFSLSIKNTHTPPQKNSKPLIIYPKMEKHFLWYIFSKILMLTTELFGFSVIPLISFSIHD